MGSGRQDWRTIWGSMLLYYAALSVAPVVAITSYHFLVGESVCDGIVTGIVFSLAFVTTALVVDTFR